MSDATTVPFADLLRTQVGLEFSASHQYAATAVWFDSHDYPRLATHFYRQSVEERNHAMMMVQYLLDRDWPIDFPAIEGAKTDFSEVIEPISMALIQEKTVTSQVEALFRAARAEGDVLGEQFMLWFLKEQVEEVAAMSTLLTVAERAGDNYFYVEDYLARENVGDAGGDAGAPACAGGAL